MSSRSISLPRDEAYDEAGEHSRGQANEPHRQPMVRAPSDAS